MKKFLFTFLLNAAIVSLKAQLPLSNTTLVNGYETKVKGEDFLYYSSIPVAKESLLIRATDGNYDLVWQTAAVPEKITTKNVTFVWLAGIGSSPGVADFYVEINGKRMFTFSTDGSNEWNYTSDEGINLLFKKDMTDQHGDHFGFMYLTYPAGKLKAGEKLNIRIVGGKFNKNSWYMTFKFPIEDKISIKTLPAISIESGKEKQLAVAGILYFGDSTNASIFVDGSLIKSTPLHFGYNYVKLDLPAVNKTKTVDYVCKIGKTKQSGKLTLEPVKHWNVNFVQHSHTDIGYTRSQTEILAEHLRYIDYALDYCDNTDNYPDAAKFRWTCEASWAVDEYLKSRPQVQIERLKKRIKEGRIEVTGMYFNFDELPDEQVLTASLQALKNIRENGIDVHTAMQDDVNGIGWGLCDYFSEAGVKYLNMGTHGHRALICFDKPTVFWWESPSGNRMLAFRAEHYMTGNTVFKIHAGDFNVFEDELLTYLQDLQAKGYPYDIISIQHSGYLVDNSPPSTLASDMIRQWNEKYAWPKLRTATTEDFFKTIEATYDSASFPVVKGAWPDWWTDGFGASAREVAALRRAQNDFISNTSALTMAAISGEKLPENLAQNLDDAENAMLFYTEHTVGYHASVREPFSYYTMEQRAIKESYAWEAARRASMLGEDAMGILQSEISRGKDPMLVVYNTLNWKRSGLVKVYIDHQIVPRYTAFSITDNAGNKAAAQAIEHHSDGSYYMVWVGDVPAFGYKKYKITLDAQQNKHRAEVAGNTGKYENQWYSVTLDTTKGVITSLYDKDMKREWVDGSEKWKLGEFIFEQLDNRAQMEAHRLDNFTRKGLDKVWFDAFEQGDVWDCIRFKGNTEAAMNEGDFSIEIRIFKTTKRIDLAYFINKKLETKPEGIYIAFPFVLPDGKLSFDVQGGEVQAGIDQINGSSNDWNTVQHYARLHGYAGQMMISSVENPLMQFGGINTGRYKAGALPESTHIFGWPMNNYWTTNFNADQHGGHQWIYTISSTADTTSTEAIHFGWGNAIPFAQRVIPGGGTENKLGEADFLEGWKENLLLVSAIPSADGRSAILHLRETAGIKTEIKLTNPLTGKSLKLTAVDVTGKELRNERTSVEPFGNRFLRLEW